jgi:hypothetical protein
MAFPSFGVAGGRRLPDVLERRIADDEKHLLAARARDVEQLLVMVERRLFGLSAPGAVGQVSRSCRLYS